MVENLLVALENQRIKGALNRFIESFHSGNTWHDRVIMGYYEKKLIRDQEALEHAKRELELRIQDSQTALDLVSSFCAHPSQPVGAEEQEEVGGYAGREDRICFQ